MGNRPRILHIYKDFWPPIMGGAEKTINLMCHAVKDNYRPLVLVSNRTGRTEYVTADGFEVTKAATFGRYLSAPLTPRLAHCIRTTPADLIQVHLPNPTAEIAILAARPKVPVLVTWHSDIVRQAWALKVYGPVHRRFLDRADCIMPTSMDYLDSSEELRPFRSKCTVVPLAIRADEYKLNEKEQEEVERLRSGKKIPVISFVGRLRYYKGLHILMKALRELNAEAWIIGTGPEERNLRMLAAEYKLSDRVQFLGDLSDHEVKLRLHASDIYCLPSHLRAEAFGLNQIEAMACGLPVVSARVGGVAFVNKDGESGLIVPPGDSVKLAEACNRLLANADLRTALSAGALARAQKEFDLPVLQRNLLDLYGRYIRP